MRRVSRAITAACSPLSGATPPTTLVPPPNGTTASEAEAQARSNAITCSWERGKTTASGAPSGVPARIRTRSG